MSKLLNKIDKKQKELFSKYEKEINNDKLISEKTNRFLLRIYGAELEYNSRTKIKDTLIGFDIAISYLQGKIKNVIILNEKQKQAFKYFQTHDNPVEILYGGGAGGGKTFLIAFILLYNCLSLPGSVWFVGRKSLKSARDSTINQVISLFHKVGMTEGIDYSHNRQHNIIYINTNFTNQGKFVGREWDSRIKYGDVDYLPSDPLYSRLQGFEFTGVFLDEVQEIHVSAKESLKTRIRKTTDTRINVKGDLVVRWFKPGKMFYSCNPGTNWTFNEFYEPYSKQELSEDKKFIQALPKDNEFIDETTLNNYKNLKGIEREIYYEGKWEGYRGDNNLFNLKSIEKMFLIDEWQKEFQNDNKYYITADIAGKGKDKTVIMIWKGLQLIKVIIEDKSDQLLLKNKIKQLMLEFDINENDFQIAIDSTGIGTGISDMLLTSDKGAFNGAAHTLEKKEISVLNSEEKNLMIKYENDRTYSYYYLADMIFKNYINIDLQSLIIEKDSIGAFDIKDTLKRELMAVKTKFKEAGKKSIIGKEEIKKEIGKSPDFADALSMRAYLFLKEKFKNKIWIPKVSIYEG